MSRIPSSAMPHAAPNQKTTDDQTSEDKSPRSAFSFSKHAGNLADKARANPTAAVAAGAAIVAGAVAAAAIPIVRSRSKSNGSGRSKSKAKSDS